jgi:hypothetical protein
MPDKKAIEQSNYKRIVPADQNKKENRLVSACCPITQQWTIVENRKAYFSIPGGQASWWYCEECHGWHILVQRKNKVTSVNPWKFRRTNQTV